MSSRENMSTILIIDQKKGKTKSLSIKTKHLNKLKYYTTIIALVILTLSYLTVMLSYKINNNEKEKRGLLAKISTLKSKIPPPTDTTQAKNYIQSIEDKLKKINEYLRKRGVKGFTSTAVGGNNEISEKLTLEENYDLFDERLEKVFAGLIYTPTGFPSKPNITSSFGFRNDPFQFSGSEFHAGLDFKGNKGDQVRSTAHGTVIHAGWYQGYGNCVRIAHKNGLQTLYGHLSEVKVKKGDKVSANQVIGLVGSTGHSTGNHLHYEVRKNNKPINPSHFLSLN
jgi:murein DD-endopeptidase MepM/ murein hydrolase activator NlpD